MERLHYFWEIARKGSISSASEALQLSPQTLSGQLASFEKALGGRLFIRKGRQLLLTHLGKRTFEHADRMFRIAEDLREEVELITADRVLSLSVGIAASIHKLFAYRLIEPALKQREEVYISCRTGQVDYLLHELEAFQLDLVLTDRLPSLVPDRPLFSMELASSSVSLFAAAPLAGRLRIDFPESLHQQPFLAATHDAPYFRQLMLWLSQRQIEPDVRVTVDDSALIKVFGAHGGGVFAAPTAVEGEVIRQYQVELIGRIEQVQERMYGYTRTRHVRHPGILAIQEASKKSN